MLLRGRWGYRWGELRRLLLLPVGSVDGHAAEPDTKWRLFLWCSAFHGLVAPHTDPHADALFFRGLTLQ